MSCLFEYTLLPVGHICGDICLKTTLKLTKMPQPGKMAWWPQTKFTVLVDTKLVTGTVDHGCKRDSPPGPMQVLVGQRQQNWRLLSGCNSA